MNDTALVYPLACFIETVGQRIAPGHAAGATITLRKVCKHGVKLKCGLLSTLLIPSMKVRPTIRRS